MVLVLALIRPVRCIAVIVGLTLLYLLPSSSGA
jgi:hypothetical protein